MRVYVAKFTGRSRSRARVMGESAPALEVQIMFDGIMAPLAADEAFARSFVFRYFDQVSSLLVHHVDVDRSTRRGGES